MALRFRFSISVILTVGGHLQVYQKLAACIWCDNGGQQPLERRPPGAVILILYGIVSCTLEIETTFKTWS